MWLLLVEDEERLAESLKRGLEEEGYAVDVAFNGIAGEVQGLANEYDVAVVDWRLPGRDGRTIVANLRAAGRTFPILMLTALGDVEHRVAGLDAGADDYLSKPFAFEELLARLRALLRRAPVLAQEAYLEVGPLEMDAVRRQISLRGMPLLLRPKEQALLELFMRNPDTVLSRTAIAERVWGSAFDVSDNVIDVTVSNLRQKLAEHQAGRSAAPEKGSVTIETTRGVGYRLSVVS